MYCIIILEPKSEVPVLAGPHSLQRPQGRALTWILKLLVAVCTCPLVTASTLCPVSACPTLSVCVSLLLGVHLIKTCEDIQGSLRKPRLNSFSWEPEISHTFSHIRSYSQVLGIRTWTHLWGGIF